MQSQSFAQFGETGRIYLCVLFVIADSLSHRRDHLVVDRELAFAEGHPDNVFACPFLLVGDLVENKHQELVPVKVDT